MGNIVKSTSLQKFGDPEKPTNVVFLHYPKSDWVIERKEGSRFKYVRTEPRNAANETLPWTFWAFEDGTLCDENDKGAQEWRRVKRLSVFGIMPDDIAAAQAEMKKVEADELPDPSKALTPVMLSFRSSSYQAGKEVCTFFTQAQSMNVPIWKYQLELGCKLEKNDDGSFYVYVIDRNKCKGLSKDHQAIVEGWANLVNSQPQAIQVDETGEDQAYGNSKEAKTVSQATKNQVC